jgi:hypothetical protein
MKYIYHNRQRAAFARLALFALLCRLCDKYVTGSQFRSTAERSSGLVDNLTQANEVTKASNGVCERAQQQ